VLSLENVALGHSSFTLIENANATIPSATFTALVGASGSGKSTLLAAIAGHHKPSCGTISLDGKNIFAWPKSELEKRVALLPQTPRAFMELTVSELVLRGREPHRNGWLRRRAKDDDAIVDEAMRLTGVYDLRFRPLDGLSGGQFQRAWIAKTLAQQTETILLDEPTRFLSPPAQDDVLALLETMKRKQNKTIVAVLHDPKHVAQYADQILTIEDGRLFQSHQ
jgi:iron complex transport system ATP-binding protein